MHTDAGEEVAAQDHAGADVMGRTPEARKCVAGD